MHKHIAFIAMLLTLKISVGVLVGLTTDVYGFTSIFHREVATINGIMLASHEASDKVGEWSYCDYISPDEVEYAVDLMNVDQPEQINGGDTFKVDMTFVNNSNTRLFSNGSKCKDKPVLNVGTQMNTDRTSIFGVFQRAVSGWIGPNRIEMVEDYVDPGEEFHVAFESIAPNSDDIFREFFQPVVEGEAWLDEVFILDIPVGNPSDGMKDNISFVANMAIAASSLEGLERIIEIDLGAQMMYTRFGDMRVWGMQISSGHWRTPSPTGEYNVIQKQELRIGGAYPHYRMPYWLGWRWDGYGIHALPYLANDGGVFWSEALTHIGIPVSHGCIRVLPDDSRILFTFAEIGTPVSVHH